MQNPWLKQNLGDQITSQFEIHCWVLGKTIIFDVVNFFSLYNGGNDTSQDSFKGLITNACTKFSSC